MAELKDLELMMTDLRDYMQSAGVPVLERRDIKENREYNRGAYGRLILGSLKSDGSRVIIKRMLFSKYDVPHVELFVDETKLLSTIQHPNIVSLLAVCIGPTDHSPVMEFMEFNFDHLKIDGLREGSTLAELLSILADAELVDEVGVKQRMLHNAAVGVVTGLAFLHHKDICHGDVKPANILVTNTGDLFTFKLADFGEARATNLKTETSHIPRGTKRFFAPEQLLHTSIPGDFAALKRIDIWNFGMVLFCMLSPDIMFPWDLDVPSQHDEDKVMKAKMADRKLPRGSDTYKHLLDQTGLFDLYKMCCQFDPADRPNIEDIQYELNSMTYSHRDTRSSASPAAAAEHVDSGAQAGVVPENAEQHPQSGFESEMTDHSENRWMSPIEDLRDAVEKYGIPILAPTDVKEDEGDGIGGGGYGVVRVGTLKADKSRVAIKRMLDYNDDEDHHRLFRKEIKLLAKTTVRNHPNIVRLLGVCLEPVKAILECMEFSLDDTRFRGMKDSVKGNNTLAHLLRILDELKLVEEVGVKQGVLRQAAVDVAAGLAFFHENDICHRDLKPSNVLVTNFGESFTFKLTDFGESRASDLQTASILHTSTYRVARGTPTFQAPEQLPETPTEAYALDLKRIDIWGYGLILFCILAPDLKRPWERERTDCAMREAMKGKKLPRGSDKYTDLQEQTGLGEIYTSCCQYEPARRPAMTEVVDKLTNMTDRHKNTGNSASLAALTEHVDSGAQAVVVPENATQHPQTGFESEMAD